MFLIKSSISILGYGEVMYLDDMVSLKPKWNAVQTMRHHDMYNVKHFNHFYSSKHITLFPPFIFGSLLWSDPTIKKNHQFIQQLDVWLLDNLFIKLTVADWDIECMVIKRSNKEAFSLFLDFWNNNFNERNPDYFPSLTHFNRFLK